MRWFFFFFFSPTPFTQSIQSIIYDYFFLLLSLGHVYKFTRQSPCWDCYVWQLATFTDTTRKQAVGTVGSQSNTLHTNNQHTRNFLLFFELQHQTTSSTDRVPATNVGHKTLDRRFRIISHPTNTLVVNTRKSRRARNQSQRENSQQRLGETDSRKGNTATVVLFDRFVGAKLAHRERDRRRRAAVTWMFVL